MRKGKYITWSELKVGILVLATFFILALGIFFLGREGGLFAKRYKIKTYMERINGLQVSAPVWLAGVNVGSVSDIQFPHDITRKEIEVTMEINEKVKDRIRKDSKARIGTLGLLGDKFVSITQGSVEEEVVPPGGVIEATTPIDVEELITTASGAIDNLVVAIRHAQNITRKIDEGSGTLGKLINEPTTINEAESVMTGMNQLISKINAGEGTVGLLINDSNVYNRLSDLLTRADALANDIEEGVGTLGKFMNDPRLYENLVSLSAGLDSVVTELRAGEGTAGKLLSDEELYEQMIQVSTELRALLEDVRENPGRYINVKIF